MNSVQVIKDSYGKPDHVVWIMPFEKYQALQKKADQEYDCKKELMTPNEVVGIKITEQCSIVCAWRKYLRMTQKDVATALGITQGSYSTIEKSENPQRATLEKLAKVFDIPVGLLTLED